MNKKNSILIILTPGFPANEKDSSCLPAQQQLIRSLNLIDPGLKIIILSFQYPYSKKSYRWFGNVVISLGGRNRQYVYRLFTWYKAWVTLVKLSKRYSIKGIFCFWYGECSLVGKMFSRRVKAPFYSWILGQDARTGNKYPRLCKLSSNELISVSDSTNYQFFQNYNVHPGMVLPNGILPGIINKNFVSKDIDIIGVGSLITLKQFHLFVELVDKARIKFPKIKAVICGDGPLKNDLLLQIHQLELENVIELFGNCTHEETLSFMQRSKVLIHPSSYEGFSGACLEALYAGCHVISFCKPMMQPIRNWHVVSDLRQMLHSCEYLLGNRHTQYESVLPYNMIDNARKLKELFP